MAAKLGILAGGGDLPRVLVQTCHSMQRDVFVVAFEGQADPELTEDIPHLWARLGAAGKVIDCLRKEGVEELVFAGSIRRPSLAELRPDWRAAKLFAKKGKQLFGDDALLQAVCEELEGEGFNILGAHEVVQDVLAPQGAIGKVSPTDDQLGDIDRGVEVIQALGRLDVGQAAVVQQGLVLGVEAIEGTDALLERCTKHVRKGDKGVLVKTCKPQQDRRMDMPTVGVRTIENAAQAGLGGVAVQAGQTILLDREKMAERADQLGVFLYGVEISESPGGDGDG